MARDQMTNRQKTQRELKPKVVPFRKNNFVNKFLSPKKNTPKP